MRLGGTTVAATVSVLEGPMWSFRILPVLIVLICADVANASPAQVTGNWSYDIVTSDARHSNSGGIQGIGDLFIDQFSNASLSFDITTAGVRVSTLVFSPEGGMHCGSSTAGFLIIDMNAGAAISGEGRGCTSSPSPGDVSVGFTVFGTGQAFVEGDTSPIQFSLAGIGGFAAFVPEPPEPAVSEPADFGFLALSACLAALYGFRRRQLS